MVNCIFTTNVLPTLATAGKLSVPLSAVLSGCHLCSFGSNLIVISMQADLHICYESQ